MSQLKAAASIHLSIRELKARLLCPVRISFITLCLDGQTSSHSLNGLRRLARRDLNEAPVETAAHCCLFIDLRCAVTVRGHIVKLSE